MRPTTFTFDHKAARKARGLGRIRSTLAIAVGVAALALASPAFAGPPYLTDDPEPTDTHHFEIYAFNSGTVTRDGAGGETGIDFNYGAAPDLQLTATVPVGFDRTSGERLHYGFSNLELAAKYRFLHQEGFGLDVSFFPRVFLPSGSNTIGDNRTSFLMPIWAQKDWNKDWSTFGGGGCVISDRGTKDFCQAGLVVTYLVQPDLQVGPELFHQTADVHGTPASSSIGFGVRYDVNDTYHVLGYVNRGVENPSQTDQFSWYTAVLFTF